METILWALDLALLAAFCFWALRQDKQEQDRARPGSARAAKDAAHDAGHRAGHDPVNAAREGRDA